MARVQFGMTIGGNRRPIAEVASRAEALGFDSLWTGGHLVWRTPTFDVMAMLAAIAAVTKRVRIGPSILLVPLQHPVVICKAVTTLDHISNGRFSFGIGIGGEYPKEFNAVGVPVKERGPRTNEALELMKRLWTEDKVTFNGRFFKLQDTGLDPKPVQKPHPPIIVAGRKGSIARTAKYGDGWMPYMVNMEMYRDWWRQIEEQASALGRDPSKIERQLFVFITVAKSKEEAVAQSVKALGQRYAQDFSNRVYSYHIAGTAQQCAERIHEWIDLGVQHFIFSPSAGAEDIPTYPEIIASEVLPLVKRR